MQPHSEVRNPALRTPPGRTGNCGEDHARKDAAGRQRLRVPESLPLRTGKHGPNRRCRQFANTVLHQHLQVWLGQTLPRFRRERDPCLRSTVGGRHPTQFGQPRLPSQLERWRQRKPHGTKAPRTCTERGATQHQRAAEPTRTESLTKYTPQTPAVARVWSQTFPTRTRGNEAASLGDSGRH